MIVILDLSALLFRRATSLPATRLKHRLVVSARQSLTEYRFHIVPGIGKDLLHGSPQVLVEFQLHASASMRTSTYRSRDISAPYAIAARMSSRFN